MPLRVALKLAFACEISTRPPSRLNACRTIVPQKAHLFSASNARQKKNENRPKTSDTIPVAARIAMTPPLPAAAWIVMSPTSSKTRL